MNHYELQAFRRLLFFSERDAANMIGGGSVDEWHRWEYGICNIPAGIPNLMKDTIRWRANAIQRIAKEIRGGFNLEAQHVDAE